MTVVQQVLFAVEATYLGNPYYVSGNALFNAVARRVDESARRSLCVSHGVFVPGEWGDVPETHSRSSVSGKLGTSLPPVEAYEDLFVFRDAAQRWLKEERPRDAHNTLDVQRHGGRLAFASECHFGRPPEVRNSKRTVQWFLQCYVHAEEPGVVPLAEDVLDGIRVGGARNYGFGELAVQDTQVVDLDELDYSGLTGSAADEFVVELVTPYVLSSEYPGADDQSIPWWWDADGVRRREERLVEGADVYELATVDHGQVVGYAGSDPVATARNGVTRVGTHSRFGFGELRVRPAGQDRVAERAVNASRRDDGEVSDA
ncbi:hypothetical protein [Salinarchaeum laminariae]|uniref:hypothetical protein n=1 Tax=Salinarchaeum laminariae TaxID=869888 RepID=UPI0020BF12C4|nr:hypothetical protein [Salinarchaeum laminariae]